MEQISIKPIVKDKNTIIHCLSKGIFINKNKYLVNMKQKNIYNKKY